MIRYLRESELSVRQKETMKILKKCIDVGRDKKVDKGYIDFMQKLYNRYNNNVIPDDKCSIDYLFAKRFLELV